MVNSYNYIFETCSENNLIQETIFSNCVYSYMDSVYKLSVASYSVFLETTNVTIRNNSYLVKISAEVS